MNTCVFTAYNFLNNAAGAAYDTMKNGEPYSLRDAAKSVQDTAKTAVSKVKETLQDHPSAWAVAATCLTAGAVFYVQRELEMVPYNQCMGAGKTMLTRYLDCMSEARHTPQRSYTPCIPIGKEFFKLYNDCSKLTGLERESSLRILSETLFEIGQVAVVFALGLPGKTKEAIKTGAQALKEKVETSQPSQKYQENLAQRQMSLPTSSTLRQRRPVLLSAKEHTQAAVDTLLDGTKAAIQQAPKAMKTVANYTHRVAATLAIASAVGAVVASQVELFLGRDEANCWRIQEHCTTVFEDCQHALGYWFALNNTETSSQLEERCGVQPCATVYGGGCYFSCERYTPRDEGFFNVDCNRVAAETATTRAFARIANDTLSLFSLATAAYAVTKQAVVHTSKAAVEKTKSLGFVKTFATHFKERQNASREKLEQSRKAGQITVAQEKAQALPPSREIV